MKQNVIAIDGPAGAGKSTIAKKVAAALGFVYIDTGAMYRAVTCRVIAMGIKESDTTRISEMAGKISVRLLQADGAVRVLADGTDVTEEIRNPVVTAAVPTVSQVPAVRQAMVRLQKEMATGGRAVIDGRDIGTVVTPEACAKIFLTASASERAKRRWLELVENGYESDLQTLQSEMEERDRRDSDRELSPLLKANDAVVLDSTELSIDAVVERIIEVYRSRCRNV